MSKKALEPQTIIEWSPAQVSWVDSSHQLVTVATLTEAAPLLPSREVVVAIARRSAFVRAYRVPNASKADLRRILQVQIGQLFPIPAHELAFDFHLSQDLNSEGRLAVIAAIRASDLQSLHSQARSAGLKISRVVPVAFGSPIVARSVGQENGAVVHRTAEGLAIDLVAGGELRYSRVAAMPATGLGIEGEVSRTFAAAVLSCSPTIAAGALALPDADYSTDLWAIEAIAGSHLDINIETAEQIYSREHKAQAARMRVAITLFGVSVILGTWQGLKWSDASNQVASVKAKWAVKQQQRKKMIDGELAKGSSVTSFKQVLDRAFHPAQMPSDAIALAANTAPAGVWLTGMSVERGKQLTLRGTATNGGAIVNYQQGLVDQKEDDTARFRNVTLVFANNTEIENTPVVQFSISAFPTGNLPIFDKNAKKVVAKK